MLPLVREVVASLGRTGEVARRLRIRDSEVSRWKNVGIIPIAWWPAVLMISDERGLGLTAHRLLEIHLDVVIPHGKEKTTAALSVAETEVLPGGGS